MADAPPSKEVWENEASANGAAGRCAPSPENALTPFAACPPSTLPLTPAVLVTVTQVLGSTPREAGARMLVSRDDVAGTIGGGRLEFDAIDRARTMMAADDARSSMDVPLGPEIGQCCGGRVTLSLERVDAELLGRLERELVAEVAAQPAALIFGAGHTGRALAPALAPLPLSVRLIDSRPETLAGLPEASRPSPPRCPRPKSNRRRGEAPSSS